MGRKKLHTDDTKTHLLETAEKLLETSGLEELSARKLAAGAGLTTRAIYSVFGDMDGLIAQLAARGYLMLGEKITAVPVTQSPIADLERVGTDGFRAFALQHPHLYRLTFETIPPAALAHPDVQSAMATSYAVLMDFIVRAQDAGIGTNRAKSDIVISFHALCQGLAVIELSHQPPPVGANFWQPLAGKDTILLWQTAIRALLNGMKI